VVRLDKSLEFPEVYHGEVGDGDSNGSIGRAGCKTFADDPRIAVEQAFI
jgi:hypothetical protein